MLVGECEAHGGVAGDDQLVVVGHLHLLHRVGVGRVVGGAGIRRVLGQGLPGIGPVVGAVQRHDGAVGGIVLLQLHLNAVGTNAVDVVLVVPHLQHRDLDGIDRVLQHEVVGPLRHLHGGIAAVVRAVADDVADRAGHRVHGEDPEAVGQALDARGYRRNRRLHDGVDPGIQSGEADHAVGARDDGAYRRGAPAGGRPAGSGQACAGVIPLRIDALIQSKGRAGQGVLRHLTGGGIEGGIVLEELHVLQIPQRDLRARADQEAGDRLSHRQIRPGGRLVRRTVVGPLAFRHGAGGMHVDDDIDELLVFNNEGVPVRLIAQVHGDGRHGGHVAGVLVRAGPDGGIVH